MNDSLAWQHGINPDYIKSSPHDVIVAFSGNPNVGKSTLFNVITGMKQHTGNWAGKTVENAKGEREYCGRRMIFADLPGCYSLVSDTAEESAAASFLRSKLADVAVTVCDPLTLERGLSLFLQVKAICPKAILCINLMDEAENRGIRIDTEGLAKELHSPVIPTSALRKKGINELLAAIVRVYDGRADQSADTEDYANTAKKMYDRFVRCEKERYSEKDRLFNAFMTGKYTAVPFMLLMLFVIFWITLKGADYPSRFLSALLFGAEDDFGKFLEWLCLPPAGIRFLTEGVYRTLCWVTAVMLPPMAIFFPLFTLAEDAGILPRIAFNLDYPFRKCSACGKQALTTCMGFGCNAVGVTGCRIIQSPREKLIAILTNSFTPCNGRFPMLLTLILVFLSGKTGSGALSALYLTLFVLFSLLMTFLVSKLLSVTILKGIPSFFVLEMPPFRKPKIGETVVRSIFDRTLFVLGRAVTAAIPAGALIWIAANIFVGSQSILTYIADALAPIGHMMGLDGEILLGFIFAFPANEIVLPVILMAYTGGGALAEIPDYAVLGQILAEHGWTVLTAVNTILFSLMHWPCATTVKTIKKETGSIKYACLSVLIPTVCGFMICGLVTLIASLMQ